eukprot:238006-Pyramimonas_sp.AAC.1
MPSSSDEDRSTSRSQQRRRIGGADRRRATAAADTLALVASGAGRQRTARSERSSARPDASCLPGGQQ